MANSQDCDPLTGMEMESSQQETPPPAPETPPEPEPNDAPGWLERGRELLYQKQQHENAIVCFDKALALQENCFDSWYHRGIALCGLHRYGEAVESFDRAVEIDPSSHNVRSQRRYAEQHLQVKVEKEQEITPLVPRSLLPKSLPEDRKSKLNNLSSFSPNPDNEFNASYPHSNIEISLELPSPLKDGRELPISSSDNYTSTEIKYYNRGNSLAESGDYELAIKNYNCALKLNPYNYRAWINLGRSLRRLGRYEEALQSYDRALIVNPEAINAWGNKGVLLNILRLHKEAIENCDRCLKLNSFHPGAWSEKAFALFKLEYYADALQSYDRTLKLRKNSWFDYYNRANVLYKMRRYEEALQSYRHTFSMLIVGSALLQAGNVDRKDLKIFEMELDSDTISLILTGDLSKEIGWCIYHMQGYRNALSYWQNRLDTFQSNTPEDWRKRGILHWQQAKAHALQENWEAAKASFQTAQKQLNPEQFREEFLELLQDLIPVCQALDETETVQGLLNEGSDELERLLRDTPSPGKQLLLKRKFDSFKEMRVGFFALAQKRGQHIKALELAEERKNLCLSWFHPSHSLHPSGVQRTTEAPPPVYTRQSLEESIPWQSQRNEEGDKSVTFKYADIKALLTENTAILYWHLSSVAMTTFVIRANEKYPIVIRRDRPESLFSPLTEIFASRKPDPQAVEEAANHVKTFENWMRDWKDNYRQNRKQAEKSLDGWQDFLRDRLGDLKSLLYVDRIIEYLEGIDRLILVPHRDLHLLPLEYLFGDRFTISRVPSLAMLLERAIDDDNLDRANAVRPYGRETVISIEDPKNPDLPEIRFAQLESAVIAHLYNVTDDRRLAEKKATKAAVTKTMKEVPADIFHFTGHAEHDLDNPEKSALALAKDKENPENSDRLTLRDLFDLPAPGYNLVYLSACETGLTSKTNLIDEFVGLASGFIATGTRTVVSTLWIVDEISDALLTIEFYRYLKQGTPPVAALKQAQNWLRTATYKDMMDWYRDRAAEIETRLSDDPAGKWYGVKQDLESNARAIERNADKLESDRPYQHPYYWAGFVVTTSEI